MASVIAMMAAFTFSEPLPPQPTGLASVNTVNTHSHPAGQMLLNFLCKEIEERDGMRSWDYVVATGFLSE